MELRESTSSNCGGIPTKRGPKRGPQVPPHGKLGRIVHWAQWCQRRRGVIVLLDRTLVRGPGWRLLVVLVVIN